MNTQLTIAFFDLVSNHQDVLGLDIIWSCSNPEYDLISKVFADNYQSLGIKPVVVFPNSSLYGKNYLVNFFDETGKVLVFDKLISSKKWREFERERGLGKNVVFTILREDGEVGEVFKHLAGLTLSLTVTCVDQNATNKGVGFLNRFDLSDLLAPWKISQYWTLPDFVQFSKYITTYPTAASSFVESELQELPTVPARFTGSKVFFVGRLGKFILNRVRASHARGNIQFLQAWFHAKRGCNTVPDEFVALAKEKHRASLETPFVCKTETGEIVIDDPEDLPMEDQPRLEQHNSLFKETLSDLIDVIFPKRGRSAIDFSQYGDCHFEASNSACFERKRSQGGCREEVRSVYGLGGEGEGSVGNLGRSYLAGMRYHPRVGVCEIRSDLFSKVYISDLRLELDFDQYSLIRDIALDFEASTLDTDLFQRKLQATVACVREPLKVRVLTKCEAIPQFLAKPLQKLMWNSLREFDPFKLIGEPVESQHIQELLQKDFRSRAQFSLAPSGDDGVSGDWDRRGNEDRYGELRKHLVELIICSGDYSAATDGLDPIKSEMTLDKIMDNLCLPLWYQELCSKVLGMQEIGYGERNCDGSFEQKRGQLMGSVLSFPILCILNMMTYLMSREDARLLVREAARDGDRLRLNHLPVLINGDDILFCANREEYRRWSEVIGDIGFTKSLGKNLVSRKFCTINSCTFEVRELDWNLERDRVRSETMEKWVGEREDEIGWELDSDGVDGLFPVGYAESYDPDYDCLSNLLPRRFKNYEVKKLDYLNVGLLRGQSKINNHLGDDESPIWDIYNKCLHESTNKHFFVQQFLRFNKEKLDYMTSDGLYNLYLPRSLGGCGFHGDALAYTPYQIALASYLYRRNSHVQNGKRPVRGLGLVNTVKTPYVSVMEADKGRPVLAVSKYDVPREGWKRKLEVPLREPNGQPSVEADLVVNFPDRLEKRVAPLPLEILKTFPEELEYLAKFRQGREGEEIEEDCPEKDSGDEEEFPGAYEITRMSPDIDDGQQAFIQPYPSNREDNQGVVCEDCGPRKDSEDFKARIDFMGMMWDLI